jgi:anhydro-N-acetylmuramic acid kinase
VPNSFASPLIANYPITEERIVLGLISGTSADGVDVACVRFAPIGSSEPLEVLSFATVPYTARLKAAVLAAAANDMSLRETAVLHTQLGEFFADVAVNAIPEGDCHLVASHGQTVCHLPELKTTLQLGEGSIIANRTGILTVTDFRTADMSLGGQGAPLVPLFDAHLLRTDERVRIAVNLGGIANITVIPPGGHDVRAWDTGPANSLSDALCRIHQQGEFDPDGHMARCGQVVEPLLEELLLFEYFHRRSPKSTGLEEFGLAFVRDRFHGHGFENLLRTSLALAAQTLVDPILRVAAQYSSHPIDLVFAGGGTSNQTLMKEITDRLDREVQKLGLTAPTMMSFQDFGVSEDAREAVAFAFLGDRSAWGQPGTIPSTTGAQKAAILGKFSFPTP